MDGSDGGRQIGRHVGLQAGSVIAGRYEIEGAIGGGEVTDVFRARDLVLARSVALKLMRAGTTTRSGKAFTAAAKKAAGLSHPNIAAVYDTGEHGSAGRKHSFLVTELCAPNEVVGRWDLADVISLGTQVCSALESAHSNGIAHGNLVAENIFTTPEGGVKVADFGLSAAAQGREATEGGDVRALGALAYLLLTNRMPEESPSQLRSIRAGIPRSVEAAVMRALGTGEPITVEDFRRALGSGASVSDTRSATAPGQPSATPLFDLRWVVPVASLILIAIAAALVISGDTVPPGQDAAPEGGAETRLDIAAVSDFDPGGNDGEEHHELVGFAIDGDNLGTPWHSETYNATLAQVKPEHPGVGLVFDLGRPVQVSRVQIHSPTPGYGFELLSSSQKAEDETSWAKVATIGQARGVAELNEFEVVTARYWLIWITSLPGGGGGSVAISEVRFFGP